MVFWAVACRPLVGSVWPSSHSRLNKNKEYISKALLSDTRDADKFLDGDEGECNQYIEREGSRNCKERLPLYRLRNGLFSRVYQVKAEEDSNHRYA